MATGPQSRPELDRNGGATPQAGIDVFISHASGDVVLARELRRHLEADGYRCWMAPDDVSGPKSWAEQIVESIDACRVMLVLISSVANESDHVSKEVDIAIEHGKAVLPIRLEDVVPAGALQYLLALAQWMDAFPGGFDTHAAEVQRRVAAIIEADAPLPPPSEAPPTVDEPPPVVETSTTTTTWSTAEDTTLVHPVAATTAAPPAVEAPAPVPTAAPASGTGVVPPQSASAPSRSGPWRWIGLTFGLALVVLVVAVAAGWIGGSSSTSADAGSLTTVTRERTTSSEGPGTTADGGETAIATGTPERLFPTRADATAERNAVNLRCGGAFVDYVAGNLIDGDTDTGWGASNTDGAGESITIFFDREVRLTEVGMTPGYTKVGPRSDADCQDVFAYPYNRFVVGVRYAFDDGSVAEQRFEDRGEMQTIGVETVTSSVTITILETDRHGKDDDTIISEAHFWGYSL